MNIVEFLKPRHVLMENVTDILKFAKGQLTSYAVGRLVSMNYQARLGIMAAGAYGVPQCRMRFFLWGARPTEVKFIALESCLVSLDWADANNTLFDGSDFTSISAAYS